MAGVSKDVLRVAFRTNTSAGSVSAQERLKKGTFRRTKITDYSQFVKENVQTREVGKLSSN